MLNVECRIELRPGIAGGWSECCGSYGNYGSYGSNGNYGNYGNDGSDVGAIGAIGVPDEMEARGRVRIFLG